MNFLVSQAVEPLPLFMPQRTSPCRRRLSYHELSSGLFGPLSFNYPFAWSNLSVWYLKTIMLAQSLCENLQLAQIFLGGRLG